MEVLERLLSIMFRLERFFQFHSGVLQAALATPPPPSEFFLAIKVIYAPAATQAYLATAVRTGGISLGRVIEM
jgi:hypothetical protein